MPPQKGPIWQEFLEVKDSSGKVTKVICKHCPTEFNFPNATRMTEHITQQCRKCPSAVKAKFQTLASPPASKRKS